MQQHITGTPCPCPHHHPPSLCNPPSKQQVKSWAGTSGAARQLSGRDAAALAAAGRRRTATYSLSSSSSSDAEDGDAGGRSPAPTSQEVTARLFAKLGIKGGSHGSPGHDSDSSWASSPERGRIKAVPAGTEAAGGGPEAAGAGSPAGIHSVNERLVAELQRAQGTIVALREELAAARAQADGATSQLREVEVRGWGWVLLLQAACCCWVADGNPRGRCAGAF